MLFDLTGRRFGRWVVIHRDGRVKKATTWLCLCDCGTTRVVRGDNLRKGRSTSCGCIAAIKGALLGGKY